MTDRAAGLQKAVERHMPETNGRSSGKNTEETYIIISNICLFWCLYETDLGICLIFLWTWNAYDASDREYTDRMLYEWNLSVGRILHVLLLEEMDKSCGIEAGIQKGKPAQIWIRIETGIQQADV